MECQTQQPVDQLTRLDRRVTDLETVQAQLAEQLHESETRYRRLADHVMDVIWTMDLKLHFTEVTPSITQLLGLSVEEAIQRNLEDALTPASFALVMQVFNTELAQARVKPHERFWSRTLELESIHKDGHSVPVEVRLSVLYDEHTTPVGIMGVTRDITTRKHAERELRENQRRLTTLMSNLPGMAYRCRNDRDWTMEFVSEGCWELTGYAATDLIDNQRIAYGQLIHPADQAQVWDNVQVGIRDHTAYDLVYRIHTATGKEKWVLERGRGVFGANDELIALEGFISDVTQQKYIEQNLQRAHTESEERVHVRTTELTQATQALREHETNFEAIVNHANDGISIAAADGKTVFANTKFAEMVGYSIPELMHTTMKDLAHPDEYPMLAERLRRRLTGESVPHQYETAIRRKDGSKVPIELTAAKTLWQDQPADLVIIRDISERQRAEAMILIRLRLMEFAPTHSLAELLQKTLDEAGELVSSPIGFYHFVEADQITLSLQAWSTRTEKEFCTAAGKGAHYNIDQAGVWVDAVHQRRPVIHNDYTALPHRKGLPEGHTGVIRELVVPIVRDEQVVAILGVGNKPTEYTDQDVKLITYLADVAWEIAARKRIEQELEQHRNHLEQLVQVRTAELLAANEHLAQEMQEHKISLAKYTALFDAFPLGITIVDRNGKILESNREAARILSVPKQEHEQRTIDANVWKIIRPDGTPMPPEEFASVRALKEQRRIENIEMGIVKSDDPITWMNVTASPIPAEGLGVAVVYGDITERKRTEEKLRKSELGAKQTNLLLRSIMESPQGVVIFALDQNFCYTAFTVTHQTTMRTIWGVEIEIGMNMLDAISDPRDRAKARHNFERALRGEQFILTEAYGDPSKYRTYYENRYSPIKSETGDIIGLTVFVIDITARKQVEEQLRESEERFRSLLDSQTSNIMMLDFEGVHHYVNQVGIASMTGAGTAQDILGKRLHELYPPHIADWQLKQIRRVMTTGQGLSGDYENVMDDQSQWWHLNLQPIRNASGQVALVMVNSLNITERKRTEVALRESEERFRTLANTAPVLIWMAGTDTLCNFFNQPWLDFTGRTMEQEWGQGWTEGIHADDRQHCLDIYLHAFQARQPFTMEYRLRRADGEYRWMVDQGVPRFLPNGRFVGYIGSCLDMTERKRMEEKLHESETRYRLLAENAMDVIWTVDLQNRMTYASPSFTRLLGWTSEEAMAHSMQEAYSPESYARAMQEFQDVLLKERSGQLLSNASRILELELVHKNGTFVPVETNFSFLRDAAGKPIGVLAISRDITERKRAEESLRETNAYLENLINYANAPIIVWDPQFRITRFNHAFESLTGHREAEVLGQSLELLFPPELAASSMDLIRQTLTGTRWETVEIKILHRDGSVRTLLWNSATLFAPDGKMPIATIAQGQDITERKRMEEELRESEARTAAIVRLSPIVIGVSTVAEGRYTDVNDAFERVLGYSRAEAVGRTSHELNLWADADTRSHILRELQAHGRVENLEIRLRRKSGEVFPALMFITPIVLRNTPCLIAMMMDITERKRAEEQLRETRDALQAIIYASPLAIYALNRNDLVTMWNPAAEEMFGWSDQEVLGQLNPTVPASKQSEYLALRQATLNGMAFSNLDTMRQKKDGALLQVSLSTAPMRGGAGQVVGRVHVIADITERKRAEEQLRHMSTHDPLTGVYNRVYFETELARLEQSHKFPISICIADLDNMKKTNDTLGHAAGDELLKRVAQVLQSVFRASDTLARIGGDEFALILPGTDQATSERILHRIRENLAGANARLPDLPVALSLGMATAEDGNLMEAFKLADTRMYEDKRLHKEKN